MCASPVEGHPEQGSPTGETIDRTGWLFRRVASLLFAALTLSILVSLPARAYDYGPPLDVESEEDIYELFSAGELTEEETERIIAMFNNRLDINRATVEELYGLPEVDLDLALAIVEDREQNGFFKSVDDLARVSGVTERLIGQVRPFARARARVTLEVPVQGSVKSRVAYEFGDRPDVIDPDNPPSYGRSYSAEELGLDTLPEAYLRVRSEVANRVDVGVLATVDEGISTFEFDEAYQALRVGWSRPLFTLQKAYAMMEEDTWEAVVGHYGIGFGQKLVFDETRRPKPNGIVRDDEINGTTRFSVPQRLFGAAATYSGINLGPSTLELTGFFSHQAYDIFQYNLSLDERSEEASDDDTSTVVYLGELRLKQQTLPNLYRETIVGGHAVARLDRRNYIGLTGYFSKIGKDFDFTFNSGAPRDRDTFGAVGLDFGAQLWQLQFYGEGALMDNGSHAAILKSIIDIGPGEIILGLRSYGQGFDNPHSRGFSDADVYERERDRDETGGYVEVSYKLTQQFAARVSTNLWYRPSLEVARLWSKARLEYVPRRAWRFALIGEWKDKSLAKSGRHLCYESNSTSCTNALEAEDVSRDFQDEEYVVELEDTYVSTTDESSEGWGARGQLALRVTSTAISGLRLTGFYRRTYTDANYEFFDAGCCSFEYGWQVGQQAWIKARYNPVRTVFVTGRFRYLDEDVYGGLDLRTIESYLEWSQRFPKRLKYAVRYEIARDLPGHLTCEDCCCGCVADSSCLQQVEDGTFNPGEDPGPWEHAILGTLEVKF